MNRSRLPSFPLVLALSLALAGCGGHYHSADADGRNAKARARLASILKRLQPVLTKENRTVAGTRKALLARSVLPKRARDLPSGDGTVAGYDEFGTGFWYSTTTSGRVSDTAYYSDQAMTTQVGYTHVDNGKGDGTYPDTSVYNEEITTGPYKHKSSLTITDYGSDANGYPQEDATASWVNTDGTSGNYHTTYQNGGSNYTRTDVDAGGNSITSTWVDGGINPTTVSFRNTDGTDGSLALQTDRSGTGTVDDTQTGSTDTMQWPSNGQGTVDYGNGTPAEPMDMNPYITLA